MLEEVPLSPYDTCTWVWSHIYKQTPMVTRTSFSLQGIGRSLREGKATLPGTPDALEKNPGKMSGHLNPFSQGSRTMAVSPSPSQGIGSSSITAHSDHI